MEHKKWLTDNFKDEVLLFAKEKTPLGDNLTKAIPYIKSDPFITTSEDQVSHQDDFIKNL